jgi:hypothetical protein
MRLNESYLSISSRDWYLNYDVSARHREVTVVMWMSALLLRLCGSLCHCYS